MTYWASDFMGRDSELFPRTLGEEVAAMVRRRWPRDTAKQVAKAWDLDPKTARNVTEGHASERTLTKALKAEGWGFLEILGHSITGQSYVEWLEQRHEAMVREAELAEQNIRRLRAQGSAVASQFADPDGVRGGEVPAPRRSARG